MRTLVIIIGGLALLGIFLAVGRLLSTNGNRSYSGLFWTFATTWAILAAANMWVGVMQAGYTFMEELPIFLLIFLGPVVPGYFIQKRLQNTGAGPPESISKP